MLSFLPGLDLFLRSPILYLIDSTMVITCSSKLRRMLNIFGSWYQDPNLNVEQVSTAMFDYAGSRLEPPTPSKPVC